MRLVSDGVDLDLRDISGSFGGGTAGAHLEVRRRGEGVEADGRVLLDKVEIPALIAPTAASAPPRGRLSLSLDLGGSGRTPLQLVQSLSGQGTIVVQNLEVGEADPSAVSVVLADTAGLATPPDERHTALLFDRALMRGPLRIPAAESTLSTVGGVVRLSPARAQAGDTRLAFSGSLDLSRLLMDSAIEYEGPPQSGTSPTGTLSWRGTVMAPDRRVGATGLTSVIALRAIERETRRLEDQRGGVTTPAAPTAASSSTPSSSTPSAILPSPLVPAPAAPAATTPAPRPAAPAPRPAAAPAPQPARPARASDAIERRDLPAPTATPRPTPFGTGTSTPAAGAGTAPATASPAQASPAPSSPTQASPAQTSPAPGAASPPSPGHTPTVRRPLPAAPPPATAAQQTPARTSERPPASVVRPPLPLEPTLPPTRGFGDLPRPPGLVGE
nr:AsmA-like C-terminal region-containing protein [Xanthobacter agilis]